MCKSNDKSEASRREFNVVSLILFNLVSIRLVILQNKYKKETSTLCKYKIDTISNGNLMPINMFKMLFPNTTIADLNKSTDK